FAREQQEQESLLGTGWKGGKRDTGNGKRGCRTRFPFLVSRFLLQDVLAHARDFRRSGDVELPRDRIRRRPDGRQQSVQRSPPARKRAEESLASEELDLALEHVHGVSERRLEAGCAPPLRPPGRAPARGHGGRAP